MYSMIGYISEQKQNQITSELTWEIIGQYAKAEDETKR